MAQDPRKFTVIPCDAEGNKLTTQSAEKRGWFDSLKSITKLGDVEILNDIGFGPVRAGLKTLSATSDAIRTGAEYLSPGITQSSVLAETGIDENVLAGNGTTFHPEVANRAYGQAQVIADRVKQGRFQLSDIPGTFQDLQNAWELTKGIFTPDPAQQFNKEMCQASPYAMDLIERAPKHKFMFFVDFVYNDKYHEWSEMF